MTNELIEQIGGRERLQSLVHLDGMGCVIYRSGEVAAMARALLEVLDAKPVGVTISPTIAAMDGVSQVGIEVYTTPPAASVPVSKGYKLPDGWIKCSERMPVQKQSNRYIPMNLLLNERTVAQGGFDDGEFWIDGLVVNNVTRWMPLPAAPAPGDKK